MGLDDEQRVDDAVKRGGRACAGQIEGPLESAYGHDWLRKVNESRAALGYSAGRGLHDNRFVLALVAHDPALAEQFDDDERAAARQLNGLANARAHDDQLREGDAERAEALAGRLDGGATGSGPGSDPGDAYRGPGPDRSPTGGGAAAASPGPGFDFGMDVLEEEWFVSLIVAVPVVMALVLDGWLDVVAKAVLIGYLIAGVWRALVMERWATHPVGGPLLAAAITAGGLLGVAQLEGVWGFVSLFALIAIAWAGADMLTERLSDEL